jgi:hypothetical protein
MLSVFTQIVQCKQQWDFTNPQVIKACGYKGPWSWRDEMLIRVGSSLNNGEINKKGDATMLLFKALTFGKNKR